MIEWPPKDSLEKSAKKVLDLFKKTGFAAELEADGSLWRFRSYARDVAPPARMVLRSQSANETRIFALEETGIWRRVVDQDVR
ncbi:hypothetical protein BH09MYX1_BH09MYX1_63030 [soil metagenome]